MDRRTLDQTASERLLHRVLYAIKFLRAMVLHVSLAALAALVFATTGVIGLYPVADVYCFDPVTAELTRVGSLAEPAASSGTW